MSDIWLNFIDKLPDAVVLTAMITFIGFFLAQTIALICGSLLHVTSGWTRRVIRIYPFVFRGTPLLIQLFLFYYGLSQIEWIRESIIWGILGTPVGCIILAVSLNAGAYSSELMLGALQNIPEGQREAGKAIGLSRLKILVLIELPQAYRFLIPSLSNEVIFILKGSALASMITLMELTGITKTFIAKTFSPFEFFIAAGLIYLLIGYALSQGFRWLEKKYAIPGR